MVLYPSLSGVSVNSIVPAIGLFACTFTYLCIWVHTGEVNSKRIREYYLKAVLRQDVAYFDDVGAGEVATRIQTDTRAFYMMYFSISVLSSPRFGTTGYIREGRACSNLRERLHYRIRYRIRPFLAVGPGAFLCPTCFRPHGRRDE